MTTRLIPVVVLGSLLCANVGGQGALEHSGRSPSEIARALASQRSVVQVPATGRVKASWAKDAPRYDLPSGSSTVLLLQLPDYKAPFVVKISSARRGLGRTTEIFIPSAVVLDGDFGPLTELGEERFGGQVESLVGEVRIDETLSTARYVFIYTRGDLVGQQVMLRGQDALDDVIGGLFQKGLFRVERSLDASMQIETRMLPGFAGMRTATSAEIVQSLVKQRAETIVPAAGKLRQDIGNQSPTYRVAGGPSTVALFQLPAYQNPYVLVVKSATRRSNVFVPSGLLFDADFRQIDEFGEDRLTGTGSLAVELGFAESTRNARYLLLYTRGDLVGMTVRVGSVRAITPNLRWLTRSLEGRLEIETRMPK